VVMGSETLVERSDVVRLGLAGESDDGIAVSQVTIGRGSRTIRPAGGKLAGLLEMRDDTITRYQSQLDQIAKALVENVNAIHRTGYGLAGQTGTDFFDPAGTTASTIKVSDAILADLSLVAASADGTVGNSDIALGIGDLRLAALIGDATVDDYYGSVVGSLGIESARVSDEKESQALMLEEINTRRESIKGVSLDEETANIIAAQHAFEAAAKMVSVIDSLMSTLITTV
jgi:flagellar hook-associated protein 1 FlgK